MTLASWPMLADLTASRSADRQQLDPDLARRRARAAAIAELGQRRERARALQADGGLRGRLLALEVQADVVPLDMRRRVAATFAACVRDLQLREALTLHYFDGAAERITAGAHLAAHAEIWIADHLTPSQAALTVAHELRHVWQLQTWPADGWQLADTDTARRYCEVDAEGYARQIVSTAAD